MKIPVLMYHAVNPDITGDPGINPIHIPLKDFEDQMKWLHENNYKTLTLSKLLSLKQKREKAEKKVVLTFDDGYVSLFKYVTPVLKKYNYSAVLFLTTGAVDTESYESLPKFEKSYPIEDRPLTWEELEYMHQNNWEIEGHGHEHRMHNMISTGELRDEIETCLTSISKRLNKKTNYYSFPYGRYNGECLKQLNANGIEASFSVMPGLVTLTSDIRILPRVEITRFTDIVQFKELIETGFQNRKHRLKNIIPNLIFRNIWLKDLLKRIKDR